jgi:hypothetical protein
MGGFEEIRAFGWALVVIGLVIVLAGGLLLASGKFPFGRLPGDIVIKREHFTVYLPIASMLIVSAVISVVLYIVRK